jgi:tRNA guanosine-2'-O-methyltransferase
VIAELQARAGVHPLLTHPAPGGGSRRCQPVIICGSLLSKSTNLGGLARTSEIFGLETLVVPDLKVTEDTSFKEVSVSAGEWMTMMEVPPSKLVPYLRLKRSEGYCIVGLEQAARSKTLGSFAFPRKMVIVLGAELLGMPVDVLQELDLVVEIPQLGLIRSLNVHVSASLLIWEYSRQMLEAGGLLG